MTRAIRVVAWITILALAAFQAYAQRYAVSPDGMSYLDLSDAVVGGAWTRLLNLYWSPLYPALIGLARLIARPGAASEVAVVHAVNFVAFVAMFAAFEYMLVSILSLAATTRRSILAGPWGLAGVYVLFACFALTMLPMEWLDPARWNAPLKPHLNVRDQLGTLQVFERFYVQNLTPLLFIALLIAVAPRGSRRKAWRNGWVLYIPALAGVTAYAMVIVTARYIMPFVLGATLVLLATLSLPRRMLPLLALFGIVIPIGLEAMSPTTVLGLALVTSVVGGMVVGVLVPTGQTVLSRSGWVLAIVLGLTISRIIFPPFAPDILRIGAALLAVLFWMTARAAIRGGRPVRFAQRAEVSLGVLLTIVLVLRLGLRLRQDSVAMALAGSDTWGNVQWNIARELASRGITPGTRIALVGPHAESYWARTGRLRIVADVPLIRTAAFWQLSPAGRDSLLAEFANAGATVAVASVGPAAGVPDSSWTAVPFHGWIRKLSP